jgi:hypothetical protein
VQTSDPVIPDPPINTWIPCKERLPKEGQTVLLGQSNSDEVVLASRHKEKWFYYENQELEVMPVKWNSEFGEMQYWTHWMMPKAPRK